MKRKLKAFLLLALALTMTLTAGCEEEPDEGQWKYLILSRPGSGGGSGDDLFCPREDFCHWSNTPDVVVYNYNWTSDVIYWNVYT